LRDLLHQFLNFSGRWDEEILLNQMVEQNAIKENDNHGAGLSAFYIGYIHFVRKQADEVLSCALRAETYWKEAHPREKATAMRLLGLGYQLKGEHSKSIELFKESLATYQSIDPEMQEVIVLLNDLAVIHREIGNHGLAEKYYQDALIIAKKNNDTEQIAGLTGNLAHLYIDDKKWEEGFTYANEALVVSEKINRLDFIAIDSMHLARIHSHKHNYEQALPLVHRAIEIFTRLRMPDNLRWAQETLAKIEKALSSNK
jgi:tetratricopeptide (TPR) repeat protein